MAIFTCMTEARGSFYLSQHRAAVPEAALRDHIACLTYDDEAGWFGADVHWVLRVKRDEEPVEMFHVGHCPGTWLWRGGTSHDPPYNTYVVRTDVDPAD
jgi:hypothetical protein